MRAHRCHTGASANKNHFIVGFAGKKLAKRSVHSDFITGFQAEHIRRHLARHNPSGARRWRGNPNIELNDALLARIVRHRVCAYHRLLDHRFLIKKAKSFPITAIFIINVKVGISNMVRRAFKLHVTTGAESHLLPFRQTQRQLLDERRYIGVGLDHTLPAFDPKHLFWDLYLHVLLDRRLTRQTPPFFGLSAIKMALFSRQHRSTTVRNNALTLGATAATSARRRQEKPRIRQCLKQLIAGCHGNGFLTVNFNIDIAGGHQLAPSDQDERHQRKDNAGKHGNAENNLNIHR